MAFFFFFVFFVFTLMVLYHYLPFKIWELGTAIYLLSILFTPISWSSVLLIWAFFISIIVCFRLPSCRDAISKIAFGYAKSSVLQLSKTEEEALSVGETWFEKGIFQGTPDWDGLKKTKTTLTEEEQAFLDNETEALCQQLDEFAISQQNDLTPSTWQYIKDKGFLGLVIEKKYGGKGFSARAHSDIVMKIASHSTVGAVTVMVPNSLGPGELLQHYGTEAQKQYYLPRLATGEHIPCFALTEPGAGSDATAIESDAIVIEKTIKGKKTLCLSITLNKRWITLAPVATLIGVAVQLKDPDNLLQGVGEDGITCVLIERDTPHLVIGNRHIPAHQMFMNGTIRGKNIIVPIEQIIGGQANAGHGWKMLVECLSIGRSISLPALAAASSAVCYLGTGAYTRVRRQFSQELINLEGIQEKMAEIGGLNYLINATRLLTVAAVNAHLKPSVSSAITKFLNTELARTTIIDAMDIHAGRAVVAGPQNYLLHLYQGLPISITVEGANILSRNLLIFGQGAMACHPYLKEEFYAIAEQNEPAFKRLLWQHLRYSLSLFAKAICSTWTLGYFISTPQKTLKRRGQLLTLLSHQFAFLADFSLMTLGGQIKRRERLSARMADALNYLYAALAVLHYAEQHQTTDDLAHAQWATQLAFSRAQRALMQFCRAFPIKPLNYFLRFMLFPFGQTMQRPSDDKDRELAKLMGTNNTYRMRLKESLCVLGDSALGKMDATFQLLTQKSDLYRRISDLKRFKYQTLKGKLPKKVEEGAISSEDMASLILMEKMRWEAEQVDEYPFDSFAQHTLKSVIDTYQNPLD